MRRAGDRKHVVESHEGVRDDDRLHRAEKGGGAARSMRVLAFAVDEELIGDPDEKHAAERE